MTKRHDLVHYIKDHRVFQHSVVVEFSQVLDLGNSALVELEIILFEAEGNGLNHRVDNTDDKASVVPVDGAQQDSEKVDIAVFDLSRLREDLVQNCDNLRKSVSQINRGVCGGTVPLSPPSGACGFA